MPQPVPDRIPRRRAVTVHGDDNGHRRLCRTQRQRLTSGFAVPTWMHVVGGLTERRRGFILRLADLETTVLRRRLELQPIVSPIFICGLARSGTTILLEALAGHPDIGNHQYRDYPLVLLPYAWTWLLRFLETRRVEPVERAHGDRIMVTPDSPEAMEEVVWRMYFPSGSAARNGDVLDASVANPVFARFYRAHIGKLLLARQARRYLSKGNYNIRCKLLSGTVGATLYAAYGF